MQTKPSLSKSPADASHRSTRAARTGITALGFGCLLSLSLACGFGGDEEEGSGGESASAEAAGPDVLQLSVSSSMGCVVRSDRRVYCWGTNFNGGLGNGTTTHSPTAAVQVSNLENVAQVKVGSQGACARTMTGEVWCWGSNERHQLGVEGPEQSATPVQVAGLTGARSIDMAGYTVAAVRADGSVVYWGSNTMSFAINDSAATPTPVPSLTGMSRALVMSGGICGMTAAGAGRCQGDTQPYVLNLRGFIGRMGTRTWGGSKAICYVEGAQASCYGEPETLTAMGLTGGNMATPVRTAAPVPGGGHVTVLPLGSAASASLLVQSSANVLTCTGRCRFGGFAANDSVPLPSWTGVRHVDGNTLYLCAVTSTAISCVGSLAGEERTSPDVWSGTGDITLP